MLTVTPERLKEMETGYPGVIRDIMYFENAVIPPCPACGSSNTALIQFGLVGRTMTIAAATTKFKLMANRQTPDKYFCNECKKFYL